ncbi:MAG: ABC transporter ATP-binding protein [Hyphomicrobiaceae bacterium]|nr:ABC transporter ATP-binding protein [Hyphomicrobiaceae bacterium]
MSSVHIQNITKSFGKVEVLKDVSLNIPDGEFVSLVGPSGCGKSTLLRIIAGLEQQSSGQIRIDDRVIDNVRPSERNISMVFQSYALYPHLSVFDNISVPLRMSRLNSIQRLPGLRHLLPGARAVEKGIRADVEQVASLLDMKQLLDRKPGELSGGQRQRVAVGRAIVREPHAFLLDEPLSNLDAKLRVHMRTEIAQLHRRLGATFIYVTHDQAEAMTMSDRIAVLMDGELVQVGSPDDVYNEPQDIRVAEFIGSPRINTFAGEIRSDGGVDLLGVPTGLVTDAEAGPAQVGLRPEALRLVPVGEGVFAGTVTHIENLGAELMVHFVNENMERPAIIRLDHIERHRLDVGESIEIDFLPGAVRLFGPDGARVPTEEFMEKQLVNA